MDRSLSPGLPSIHGWLYGQICLPSFVSAEQIVDAVNNLSSTIEGDGAAFAKGQIVGFFSFFFRHRFMQSHRECPKGDLLFL